MSLQRQFEGPDVRVLLDEICATYGTEPTIAKAESFRTGGVLGFFQKEHYRLVVEGDPAQSADTQMKEKTLLYQAPPRVDRKPARGRHFAGSAVRTEADQLGTEIDVESRTAELVAVSAYATAAGASPGEDPFASLAERTEDSFVSATSWLDEPSPTVTPEPETAARPVPTPAEEHSFESVLRRVGDFVDEPRAVPVSWPSIYQPQPPAPPQAAEAPVITPEVTDPAPETPLATVSSPMVAADLFAPSPGIDVPVTDEQPAEIAESEPEAAQGEDAGDSDADDTTPGDRPVAASLEPDRHSADPGGEQDALPVPRLSAEEASLRLALHHVGFEAEMVEQIETAMAQSNLENALLEVFESFAPPPRMPRRGGSLIVVVGSGRPAAVEARRIAAEVESDPTGVAYATERRLPWPVSEELLVRSVEDAQELAPGHRRGRVGIVVVDAAVGSVATSWARSIIHAVRPTLVVGVVDAMYKDEDISDWTERLGGVDTLVLENLDSTVSPARLLSLEIPVNRIDDSAATPTRWTAAILDRLAPAQEGDEDSSEAVGMHFAGRRRSY